MNEISFEAMPNMVWQLSEKVDALNSKYDEVLNILQGKNNPVDRWMNMDELKEYLPDKPARATIYGWVSNRQIPHHKGGKRLRFLKSEIDNWLSGGKRKSEMELEAEAATYLREKKRGRRYE